MDNKIRNYLKDLFLNFYEKYSHEPKDELVLNSPTEDKKNPFIKKK